MAHKSTHLTQQPDMYRCIGSNRDKLCFNADIEIFLRLLIANSSQTEEKVDKVGGCGGGLGGTGVG